MERTREFLTSTPPMGPRVVPIGRDRGSMSLSPDDIVGDLPNQGETTFVIGREDINYFI